MYGVTVRRVSEVFFGYSWQWEARPLSGRVLQGSALTLKRANRNAKRAILLAQKGA